LQKKIFESDKVNVNFKGKILDAEVFRTPEQLRLGLMYRDKLDKESCALFCFPEADYLSMWMKNVKIPLAVAFVDETEDGAYQIASIQKMFPENENVIHRSPKRVRLAIETDVDFFEKNGIKEGDHVVFEQ
jgi:hypothetical protein